MGGVVGGVWPEVVVVSSNRPLTVWLQLSWAEAGVGSDVENGFVVAVDGGAADGGVTEVVDGVGLGGEETGGNIRH